MTRATLAVLASVVLLGSCSSKAKDVGSEDEEEPMVAEPEPAPEELAIELRHWELEDDGRISDFAFVPGGDGRMLVLGHRGVLHLFKLKGTKLTKLGEEEFPDTYYENDCGLLSVTFDEDFEDNGFVYFGRCVDRETNRLSRHVFKDDDLKGLMDSEVEILTIPIETDEDSWHRWGAMGMEPDGVLWVLMGEGTISENAQDTGVLAGKLLRIVPSRDPDEGGYEPAEGNAFTDSEDGLPEIYAYGFRSPWRGYRDRRGRYWVGDVGANKIEEVDLVTKPGQNFGWDTFEGPCDPDEDEDECKGLTNPITSYGRESDEPYDIDDEDVEGATKRAVWISDVYEKPSEDRYYGLLDHKILFGDYFAGWIRAVEVDDDGKVVSDEFVGHQTRVTGCHLGPDGYMYMSTLGGSFYRVLQVID